MSDPTKGDAPILEAPPTITIAGTDYPLRKLGVRDTFALARIIAVGAASTRTPLDNAQMADPKVLSELLLAGFMTAENEAMKLLASVISVTVKDLEDPARFPMGSELAIIGGLSDHQDLRAFFAAAATLMARLPETRTRSRAPST